MNKTKRMAAGHLCLALFAMSSQISHQLHTIAATRDTGLGKGLTEKERVFVESKATEFHKQSQTMKKLGWRLLGWQ